MKTKNFTFSGFDTTLLAEKYGTPLYVMSEDVILDRIYQIQEEFLRKYPATKVFYASKAFLCLEMCRILQRQGIGLDTVSAGEIHTALKAGFDPQNIVFHGSNKSESELMYAIENQVGKIVIDSISEIDLLEGLSSRIGKDFDVLVRINPSTETDTHKHISTGQKDSKFGVPFSSVGDAINRLCQMKHVHYQGIHFHIGSQLFDSKFYITAASKALSLIEMLKSNFDIDTNILNIGGGFGIDYMRSGKTVDFRQFIGEIMDVIHKHFDNSNCKRPEIAIEPGRWIVAESGITLYSVGTVKEIPQARTYVSVDGGMPDNPRPILYGAEYDAVVANKYDQPADTTVTIAGKCCESGDILIHDIALPQMERGDILVVLNTGAYNYTMSSHYNRIPRPAVIFLKEGKDRLAVRRESYDDLLMLEI